MTQRREVSRTFEASTLNEAVSQAMGHLFEGQEGGGEIAFVLVFSGRGRTTAEAFRAALDDLREQCIDNDGAPVSVMDASVMATDEGSRIWGSVGCAHASPTASPIPALADATFEKGSQDRWALRITPV